uniref:Phosphate acyltransferase n=1 Tax=Magnetococcus massalia (strain MO-1) TaxID=451514 RepID=A0A1S7LED8_MAGMO|nr:fatty acid/phospholipid synthesis protein, methyltransferase domain [Candidatus Magnetococcus massalia]
MTIRIALDAMGGDHAPEAVIDGAMRVLANRSDVTFTLVGLEEVIQKTLQQRGIQSDRLLVHHASEVVAMDEKPAIALRTKKDSSMRVGANLVKAGEVDAFVSAGNTGALMATAKFVLKTLRGIDRPAIASVMPSTKGETLMLDLGANVDCSAEHLAQFALMGNVFANSILNVENPKVGLLNIGEEDMKGNEVVREAGEVIRGREQELLPGGKFLGNVEGNDIFLGDVDVVVCDGFVGNISLKSTEGAAQMLIHFLREAFSQSIWTKLAYLICKPALKLFRDRVDPRRYNGAILLGLNGVVVKSHGSADAYSYSHAIEVAVSLAEKDVNERIRQRVAQVKGDQAA